MSEIDLSRVKHVTDSDVAKKIISLQSDLHDARHEIEALRSDRAEILEQFRDLQNARPIKISPLEKRRSAGRDLVRVVFGDSHGMRIDRKAAAAFLTDVKRLDPDEIVIGGDAIECGGFLARHQPIGFIALLDYTFQEDVLATSTFIDSLQDAAPRAVIHYLEGNHEDRIERWIVDQVMAHGRDAEFLRQLVGIETLLRLKERGIRYYRRSEIYTKGCPRGWIQLGKLYFTHELGASKNAASEAVRKAGDNVYYFHTHREDSSTIVLPRRGPVKAFNPGCLCLMQPVWKHSDPTNWSQGYDINFVAKSGNFQRVNVPIYGGESLAVGMVDRLGSR